MLARLTEGHFDKLPKLLFKFQVTGKRTYAAVEMSTQADGLGGDRAASPRRCSRRTGAMEGAPCGADTRLVGAVERAVQETEGVARARGAPDHHGGARRTLYERRSRALTLEQPHLLADIPGNLNRGSTVRKHHVTSEAS